MELKVEKLDESFGNNKKAEELQNEILELDR